MSISVASLGAEILSMILASKFTSITNYSDDFLFLKQIQANNTILAAAATTRWCSLHINVYISH